MSYDYLVSLTKRISRCEQTAHRHNNLQADGNTIRCDRDLVCNGNIVASKCVQNSLVYTNQYKQLISANISNIVRGSNINIVANEDGTITVANPQNISQTSSPTFKMVTTTDIPVNQNDVVTKKYVDDKMTEMIAGLFEVDTAQIKTSSTINSENISSGSFVISGGMGIAKDLYVGGGIYLPNSNGILTKLDFFEEGTFSISWNNIWSNEISSTFAYQRIGKWVMLMFPYVSNRAIRSGIISNVTDTYLPERLQPLYDILIDISGSDNGVDVPVCVKIFGDNGRIEIKPKNTNEYYGAGISGFNTFSISYMAKL